MKTILIFEEAPEAVRQRLERKTLNSILFMEMILPGLMCWKMPGPYLVLSLMSTGTD